MPTAFIAVHSFARPFPWTSTGDRGSTSRGRGKEGGWVERLGQFLNALKFYKGVCVRPVGRPKAVIEVPAKFLILIYIVRLCTSDFGHGWGICGDTAPLHNNDVSSFATRSNSAYTALHSLENLKI